MSDLSKFLDALKSVLSKNTKQSERLAQKLSNEPEKCAEQILHHLGSQTGPIKLNK